MGVHAPRLRTIGPTGSWPDSGAARAVAPVGVVIVGLLGLAVRLWAIGRQPINSDEAIVGLMAHQILHGHFSAFYWGQNYGGGEPYIVALVFLVAGQSTFTLGLTPVVLDLIAVVLVWRIASRLFSPTVGIAAALVFWVWPEVYIWQSTIEYGFRWFVLDLGLISWLVALRIVDASAIGPFSARSGSSARRCAALGLCFGAGWWGSPEIVYYAFPVVVFLAILAFQHKFTVRLSDVAWFIGSLIVGAAPWLWANIRSGFASLHSGPQPDPSTLSHLNIFGRHVLPIVLGLQLRVSGRWLFGADAGRLVEYLAVVAGLVLLYVLGRRQEALLVVIFAVASPFIYAVSPFTWYWNDGRYALYLAPVASMLFVAAVVEVAEYKVVANVLGSRATAGSVVLALVVGLALTADAVRQLGPYRPNHVASTGSATWTSWRSDPTAGMAHVASSLVANHLTDLYAGYWVANVLAFEARGSLVATDVHYVRNETFVHDVARSAHPAWLFADPNELAVAAQLTQSSLMDPGCAVASDRCLAPNELERYLTVRRISYRIVHAGPFEAVVPAQEISPKAVLRAFSVPNGTSN